MVQGVQAAKDGRRDRADCAAARGDRRSTRTCGRRATTWASCSPARATSRARRTSSHGGEARARLAGDRAGPRRDAPAPRRAEGRGRRARPTSCRRHPNAVDARTLYVAALRESGQIDKAIAEAREVLVRKPSDATALAELALSHLAKGEKEAAALLAKQALDSSPNSAVAHRATGLLDLANGDDAEAFAEFRKASQADPQGHDVPPEHGRRAPEGGRVRRRPRSSTARSSTVNADDVEAQVGLAAALRGEADAQHPQKLEEARALLEKVLAADSAQHQRRVQPRRAPAPTSSSARRDAAPLFKRFESDAPSDSPAARRRRQVHLGRLGDRAPPPTAPSSPTPAPATPPAPAAGEEVSGGCERLARYNPGRCEGRSPGSRGNNARACVSSRVIVALAIPALTLATLVQVADAQTRRGAPPPKPAAARGSSFQGGRRKPRPRRAGGARGRCRTDGRAGASSDARRRRGQDPRRGHARLQVQ